MPEGDGAAIRVGLVGTQTERPDHRQRLRCEGLVQLDDDLGPTGRALPCAAPVGMASTGPMPITSGATPATAKPT